jgi:hypothetical protein
MASGSNPSASPMPTRNSAGVYKIMNGLYISGIEGAKDYMTLQQQGVTHIVNMVGPGVYDHPLAGGRDKSFFPQLFKCVPVVLFCEAPETLAASRRDASCLSSGTRPC